MYTERSGIVDEDNNDLLTCALVRSSKMDFATDDDVRGTVRRLAHIAATRTSGELKLREGEHVDTTTTCTTCYSILRLTTY